MKKIILILIILILMIKISCADDMLLDVVCRKTHFYSNCPDLGNVQDDDWTTYVTVDNTRSHVGGEFGIIFKRSKPVGDIDTLIITVGCDNGGWGIGTGILVWDWNNNEFDKLADGTSICDGDGEMYLYTLNITEPDVYIGKNADSLVYAVTYKTGNADDDHLNIYETNVSYSDDIIFFANETKLSEFYDELYGSLFDSRGGKGMWIPFGCTYNGKIKAIYNNAVVSNLEKDDRLPPDGRYVPCEEEVKYDEDVPYYDYHKSDWLRDRLTWNDGGEGYSAWLKKQEKRKECIEIIWQYQRYLPYKIQAFLSRFTSHIPFPYLKNPYEDDADLEDPTVKRAMEIGC